MLNLDELLEAADATRPTVQYKPKTAPEPKPKDKAFIDMVPGILLQVVIAGFCGQKSSKVKDENPFSPGFEFELSEMDATRPFLEQLGERHMNPYFYL